MKQFIWLLCGVFLSGLLLGTLSACGDTRHTQFVTAVVTTGPASGAEDGDAPEGEDFDAEGNSDEGNSGEWNSDTEDGARRLAFGKILWDAYLQGLLPDGTRLEYTSMETAADNTFALADVDGDGREELLLFWGNASMAGMTGLVYGYHDGAVQEELSEFPALTFYDNGMAAADWSHNQGWAGRFWPYTLYQYQEETGDYVQVGGVDAWDRSVTDESLPSAFPQDIDADGDGLVYFLLSGEWTWGDHTAPDGTAYSTWAVDPVDGADYENWRDLYLAGAEPVSLSHQKLTEENIAALGCPKPDLEFPEPAG